MKLLMHASNILTNTMERETMGGGGEGGREGGRE